MWLRATALVSSVGLCSCSLLRDVVGTAGGGSKPNPTVDAVLKGGLPEFLTLAPQLPEGFSSALGVVGNADGQPDPGRVTMTSEVSESSGSAAFDSLLGEARVLSAWGFSETRRLETLVQSLMIPVFDLLGRKELFEARGNPDSLGLAATRGGLFEGLLAQLQFAVKMPQLEGLPSYLVLASSADLKGVVVRGVWPSASGFAAGFMSEIRMADADSQSFTFSLAPHRMPGLVKNWKASSCDDDVFSIRIERSASTGRKSLALQSWECPSTRNAVGTVSLAFDGNLTAVESAFAQNFDNLTGPRSVFGRRQGFVLQAAASGLGEAAKLAAGIALAGENDFDRSLGELFGEFGIASLLTKYAQSKYVTPMVDTFAGGAACAIGASASQSVAQACAKKALSPDLLTEAVDGLHSAASTVGASDFERNLAKLQQVLMVRNPIFVSKGATVFRKAPDASFSALDDNRKALSTLTLAALAPRPSDLAELLPTYDSENDLPTVSFQGSAGALQSFWESKCTELASDSLAKAGRGREGVASLCSK